MLLLTLLPVLLLLTWTLTAVDDTLPVGDGVSDRDSDCDSDIEGAAEPVIVTFTPTPVPVALSLLPVWPAAPVAVCVLVK